MDVTPPSTLRRLGLALAGLAVAALTGAACALSFNELRDLAIQGQARPDLAFLYPAGFDALLVVALVGVLLLSSGRTLVRAQAAVVLVLLILAAAAVNLAKPLQVQVDVRQAALGVAVAPWVMLAIALWLWLLMIKHVQARRSSGGHDQEANAEQDIVPFRGGKAKDAPVGRAPERDPATQPNSIAGQVTRWSNEPEPAADEPEPPVEEQAPEEAPAPEPTQVEEPAEAEEPVEEPLPFHDRPVRWGDRVEPTDVLVHPRNDAPRITERDADTQPVRVFTEERSRVNPDPGHGPEAADETEPLLGPPEEVPPPAAEEDDEARRQPYSEAPSGRLRSTPLPPEE